jgi:hypothetical protein
MPSFSTNTTLSPILHPSPSEGGTKVSWVQYDGTNARIKIKELSTGSVKIALRRASIEHAHLSADANFVVYSLQPDPTDWDVYSKDLRTGRNARATGSANAVISNIGAYWQKPKVSAPEVLPSPWQRIDIGTKLVGRSSYDAPNQRFNLALSTSLYILASLSLFMMSEPEAKPYFPPFFNSSYPLDAPIEPYLKSVLSLRSL